MTKQKLWADYNQEKSGCYSSKQFYHYYNLWKKAHSLTLHMTHQAGDKMFVDYAGKKLIDMIKLLKADGSYLREISRMERIDLLVIEDFGIQVLDHQTRLSLLDIIEERYEKRSTIITLKLPVEK